MRCFWGNLQTIRRVTPLPIINYLILWRTLRSLVWYYWVKILWYTLTIKHYAKFHGAQLWTSSTCSISNGYSFQNILSLSQSDVRFKLIPKAYFIGAVHPSYAPLPPWLFCCKNISLLLVRKIYHVPVSHCTCDLPASRLHENTTSNFCHI